MSTLAQQIGRRLRAARKSAGYKSATALANEKTIPMSTYSQHESGKRALSADMLMQYSELFHVNPGWLLSGVGSPFPADVVDVASRNAILKDELFDIETSFSSEEDAALPQLSRRLLQVDMDLLSEVLLRLLPVIEQYNIGISAEDCLEFAFEVYNGVITTSATKQDKLAMIELSIASLKRGVAKRTHDLIEKTA